MSNLEWLEQCCIINPQCRYILYIYICVLENLSLSQMIMLMLLGCTITDDLERCMCIHNCFLQRKNIVLKVHNLFWNCTDMIVVHLLMHRFWSYNSQPCGCIMRKPRKITEFLLQYPW